MADRDDILAQYSSDPPTLGDGPRLPNVMPREMRSEPLSQSNLLHSALSAFGQPSLDALREGYAGRKTPQEIARTFLETGPMGPLGMARAPARIPNPITAYHGSPHDFDKFELEKIGTGEGAQAYGHGLYFAENEGVARGYRDRLASYENEARSIFARHGAGDIADDGWRHLARVAHSNDGSERALSYAVPETRGLTPAQRQAMLDEYRNAQPGRMYEVNLHARPEQFLDWDAPLSQQSPLVRDAVERRGGLTQHDPMGPQLYHDLDDPLNVRVWDALREHGVHGVSYLDQGSRAAAEGTRNFAVWSPEIIEILRKYGIAAPVAGVTTADILRQYSQEP